MAKEAQKRAAQKETLINGDVNGATTNGPQSPVAKKPKKEPAVQDIESTIPDTELEQKMIDKALDKTRSVKISFKNVLYWNLGFFIEVCAIVE